MCVWNMNLLELMKLEKSVHVLVRLERIFMASKQIFSLHFGESEKYIL